MNYYLEFSKTDGLFLTKEVIEQHNMFYLNSDSFIEEEGFDTYRVYDAF